MLKILLQITVIILVNLLAFFTVGLILDAFFNTEGIFTLIAVLISIPIFSIIMYVMMKKYTLQLEQLRKQSNDRSNE